jgi:hypothetical protein
MERADGGGVAAGPLHPGDLGGKLGQIAPLPDAFLVVRGVGHRGECTTAEPGSLLVSARDPEDLGVQRSTRIYHRLVVRSSFNEGSQMDRCAGQSQPIRRKCHRRRTTATTMITMAMG